jgi:hypothetical protein
MPPETVYCMNCGDAGSAALVNCGRCGATRLVAPHQRAASVAFLLNELQEAPFTDVTSDDQRERIGAHYVGELQRLTGVAPRGRRAQDDAPAPAAAAEQPPTRALPSFDWSWLVDQQANLLLFAGAFLTVVAALIYVGYSGEAVSGALKMSLLALYTLAFVAAGVLCRRNPRVEVAGRVFLAVGAALLPLNFVAAHNIFRDRQLDADAMWLAGSLASAGFYFLVARIGLGRLYALGAAAAVISAALAAEAVSGSQGEWIPAFALGAAAVLLLPRLFGGEELRQRVGVVWTPVSQLAAAGAVALALFVAPLVAGFETDATRWYLPATLAIFAAYGAVPAAITRQARYGAGAIAGLAGTAFGVVYAVASPAETYAVTAGAVALAAGLARADAQRAPFAGKLPERHMESALVAGIAASGLCAIVSAAIVLAAAEEVNPYELAFRWFQTPSYAFVLGCFALLFAQRERAGIFGASLALAALCASIVYGFDAEPEYYAIALAAPWLAIGAAARSTPASLRLHPTWRDDARLLSWGGAGFALLLALATVAADADPNNDFTPQRVFLPVTFAIATAFFALEASRRREVETSLALAAGAIAVCVAVPYAVAAPAEYYGVALVAAGAVMAAATRVRLPAWLDARALGGVALASAGVATLLLEATYAGAPRTGAAVHFAAAALFALGALVVRSDMIGRFIDLPVLHRVRAATLLLYPAGYCAVAGYVYVLRALPTPGEPDPGSLAVPLLIASAAFLLLGAVAKVVRPEFRMHLYLMGLVVSLAAVSVVPDARTLAVVLTALVAAFTVVAVYEDEPLVGVPATLYGFGAVAAWRAHLDADLWSLPLAYGAIALAAYAGALLLHGRIRRWSLALRASGAAYALVAPAAGFAMLALRTDTSVPFQETALYQWSTVAIALVGLVALVESSLAGRRWLIVPASAVVTAATLLQVGRLGPDNAQAYTLIIGGYLALLGIFGLGRLRLVPGLADTAAYVEAAGALIIMLPAFAQSIDGGWRYELMLLAEALAFVVVAVVLRRRGLLAAGLAGLVLGAGRVLFDGVNAMPNWLVAMVGGAALLGAGVGILSGRERWDRWQARVAAWWDEAAALSH